MAQPRQKKKQRSSRSKVKTGVSGRTKAGKKKVNFLGNKTIAENWDHKLTLAQNYERLGLSVRLNARTGGTEHNKRTPNNLAVKSGSSKNSQYTPAEVQVERDPSTGKIIRIIQPESQSSKRANPLDDPLNDIMDTSDEEEETDGHESEQEESEEGSSKQQHEIVAQLEAQAARETEDFEKKKKPRSQSSREEEWVESLVEKYGDDTNAMVKDRKFNPMQQSEGDIKRRIKKWKSKRGT